MLYRYGQCYLEKELKPYDMGSGQFIFMAALFHEDGISQENLANKLNIDKGTTARAIKKLESIGYVTREVNPKDKRSNIIRVSKEGQEIRPVLQRISQQWSDELFAGMDSEEQELIIRLLQKMSYNAYSLIKNDKEKASGGCCQ
ncbi:MAG: MarR family transcriptional regulator [Firmicutes bacterium]|nr:MarR family transcriptional regulator [Bacillota bacterium]